MPELRASQRDEEAIEAWRQERWPELKKSRAGRTHDHLSVLGGLTLAGELYLNVQERAYNSEGVVRLQSITYGRPGCRLIQ